MKKAKVIFKKFAEGQENLYTPSDEGLTDTKWHRFVRIVFDLVIMDQRLKNVTAAVKSDNDKFDVSRPENYKGPFNQFAFEKEAKQYYDECFAGTSSFPKTFKSKIVEIDIMD